MFGLVAKAIVGGAAVYGVVKLLERTQIVEKVVAKVVGTADEGLAAFNSPEVQERINQIKSKFNGQGSQA